MDIDIELNTEFKRALHFMEDTNESVFLTGRAGTGKSTLLQYFRDKTKKNAVVVAPTGVAAVNVKGQTIHSFFGFAPGITVDGIRKAHGYKKRIFKNIDTLVIDEVSMVRADLLDCIDIYLRLNGKYKNLPFGGVQMIFVGDLYQLPPVVPSDEEEIFETFYAGPYFFNAKAFDNRSLFKGLPFQLVELKKIYRQKDAEFIKILDAIRKGRATDGHLEKINKKVDQAFNGSLDDFYVHLVSTNYMADRINAEKLSQIKKDSHEFKGTMQGEFSKGYLPTSENLALKAGAQIMMLNNDGKKRWVNGDVGKILEIKNRNIFVELSDGRKEIVVPYVWQRFRYFYNEGEGHIDSEIAGSFTQYPIKLAWAVTIHKGQGKTFDKVIVDFGRGTFASGQSYVALSRCTALEGLVLKTPLEQRHIFTDKRINDFMESIQRENKTI